MKKISLKTLLFCLFLSVCNIAQASWTDEEFFALCNASTTPHSNTNPHKLLYDTSISTTSSNSLALPNAMIPSISKIQVATDQESTNSTKLSDMKNLIDPTTITLAEEITKAQALCQSNKPLAESIQDLINNHSNSLKKIDNIKQEIDKIHKNLGGDPDVLRKKINPDPGVATVDDAIVSVQNLLKAQIPLHESVQALTFERDNAVQEIRDAISFLHEGALDLKTAISDVINLVGSFDGEDLYTKIQTARSTFYHAKGTLHNAVSTIRSMIRPTMNQDIFIIDILALSAKLASKLDTLKGRNDVSVPAAIPLFSTAEDAVNFVINEIK